MKMPVNSSNKAFFGRYPRHFYIFLGIVFVLCVALYPAYVIALQYRVQQILDVTNSDKETLSRLNNHQDALALVNSSEQELNLLREDNINDSTVSAVFVLLREAFLRSDYLAVASYSGVFSESVVTARSEDMELKDIYTRKIAEVEKKRDEYKKQGINVATISASIASASGELVEKRYRDLDDRLIIVSDSLDALLAQKKQADRKAAAVAAVTGVSSIAPQSSGGVTYERKTVNTTIGAFSADILTVDMNRVKVKTFAANENDCANDCPLKPLSAYVYENGGIAGINGTYFCPADYASCSSKINSFDLLVFDYRTKKYLNSAQNQYSVNPLISFYDDGAHYYTQALGFGRDTGANGVISNFPTLIHNGGVAVNNGLDVKSSGAKSARGGIGYNGKTLWAVVTRGATVPDTAYVFKALGAQYAMNLDGGGSSAMYFNGYKVGPGRNLPNAIVFTP